MTNKLIELFVYYFFLLVFNAFCELQVTTSKMDTPREDRKQQGHFYSSSTY